MKKTELFKKIFEKPLKIEKKEWYISIPDIPHKNKKKEASRKACRNWRSSDLH